MRDSSFCLKCLARPALQHLDSFVQLIVLRVLGFGLWLWSGILPLFLNRNRFGFIRHQNVGRDRYFLNRLPAWRIIFRYRENQCAAIRQVNPRSAAAS